MYRKEHNWARAGESMPPWQTRSPHSMRAVAPLAGGAHGLSLSHRVPVSRNTGTHDSVPPARVLRIRERLGYGLIYIRSQMRAPVRPKMSQSDDLADASYCWEFRVHARSSFDPPSCRPPWPPPSPTTSAPRARSMRSSMPRGRVRPVLRCPCFIALIFCFIARIIPAVADFDDPNFDKDAVGALGKSPAFRM